MIRSLFLNVALLLTLALVLAAGGAIAQTAADHLEAGMVAASQGDDQTAVEHYSKAILSGDLAPAEAVLAHFNRGNAFSRAGAYDLAIVDYDAVLRLQPDDAEAHDGRGNALVQKGEYERAILSFTEALAVAPDSPRILYNRGNAYIRVGQESEALADYNAAVHNKGLDRQPSVSAIREQVLAVELTFQGFGTERF